MRVSVFILSFLAFVGLISAVRCQSEKTRRGTSARTQSKYPYILRDLLMYDPSLSVRNSRRVFDLAAIKHHKKRIWKRKIVTLIITALTNEPLADVIKFLKTLVVKLELFKLTALAKLKAEAVASNATALTEQTNTSTTKQPPTTVSQQSTINTTQKPSPSSTPSTTTFSSINQSSTSTLSPLPTIPSGYQGNPTPKSTTAPPITNNIPSWFSSTAWPKVESSTVENPYESTTMKPKIPTYPLTPEPASPTPKPEVFFGQPPFTTVPFEFTTKKLDPFPGFITGAIMSDEDESPSIIESGYGK